MIYTLITNTTRKVVTMAGLVITMKVVMRIIYTMNTQEYLSGAKQYRTQQQQRKLLILTTCMAMRTKRDQKRRV